MKNLEKQNFLGIWKNSNMIPNWMYDDEIEITIYSRTSFSIMVSDKKTLLVEGKLEVENIENDIFEFTISGLAISDEYYCLRGRMHMGDKTPSFVLTIPDYGERYFEKISD
jgi:hypothetical protein